MNNRQVIQKLQKIAQDLDEIGSYREAEKVDKILIKIALLSDEGAKSVIEPHPSKKYVRRYLGIPPQNIFESLQNKIDDLIGKLKKSKTINKEKLTNEFINSIFQQYQTKGYVNSAFVDFITMSAKFVEELHKIIIDNPEQQETWRKLFQDIRFTLDRNIYFEVKKLDKKTIEESKNKTKIYETIHSLLKLEDFLPTQLISTIKAYKEFLDGRSELEQHFQSIADIGEMQPNAEIIAEQELRNYSEDTENKIQKLLESSVQGRNMNNRQIIASLNKIANELDINGLYKEANSLTTVMKKIAILTGSYLDSDPEKISKFQEYQKSEEDRINKERARQREENRSNFPEDYKKFLDYSESFIRELEPMLEDVQTNYMKKYILNSAVQYFDYHPMGREELKSEYETAIGGDKILEVISFCEQFAKNNDISERELLPIMKMMAK